jgi:hypothetical protein
MSQMMRMMEQMQAEMKQMHEQMRGHMTQMRDQMSGCGRRGASAAVG